MWGVSSPCCSSEVSLSHRISTVSFSPVSTSRSVGNVMSNSSPYRAVSQLGSGQEHIRNIHITYNIWIRDILMAINRWCIMYQRMIVGEQQRLYLSVCSHLSWMTWQLVVSTWRMSHSVTLTTTSLWRPTYWLLRQFSNQQNYQECQSNTF